MKQLIKLPLLTLFLLSITTSVNAQMTSRVIDGDTIVTNSGTRVRLYCIDAPELKQPEGQLSKDTLIKVLAGNEPTIKEISSDRYGRIIGELYINNVLVNLQLVRIGQAVVYPQYCKDKKYYDAQFIAKKNKLGVWANPNFVMPWEFRKKK